jgi:hypothetical protein
MSWFHCVSQARIQQVSGKVQDSRYWSQACNIAGNHGSWKGIIIEVEGASHCFLADLSSCIISYYIPIEAFLLFTPLLTLFSTPIS